MSRVNFACPKPLLVTQQANNVNDEPSSAEGLALTKLLQFLLKIINHSMYYLKYKHLSSEHADCVKISLTDAWSIEVWSVSGYGLVRPVRVPGGCVGGSWVWPGRRTTRNHCGQRLGGSTFWLTIDLMYSTEIIIW